MPRLRKMICRAACLFFCIGFTFNINAQKDAYNPALYDSVKKVLPYAVSDSLRLEVLSELVDRSYFVTLNPDTVYKYARPALRLGLKLEDEEAVKNARAFIAYSKEMEGDFDSARYYYDEVMEYAIKYEDTAKIADIYYSIATISVEQNLKDTAIYLFLKAIELTDLYSDTVFADNQNAMHYFGLGQVYEATNNLEKARETFANAVNCNITDTQVASFVQSGVGEFILNHDDNLDSAEYHLQLALNIATESHLFNEYTAIINANLGKVKLAKAEYKEAEGFFNDALSILDPSDSIYFHGTVYESFGKIRFQQNRYSEALDYSLLALVYFKKNKRSSPSLIKQIADSYELLGNHLFAIQYLKTYIELIDSTSLVSNNKELLELTEKYESEKKEILLSERQNEIETLEAKEQVVQLRVFLIAGGATLVFIVGFLIARYRLRSRDQKARHLQEIGEFKEAMTGMIAHDLKNPLSVIMGSQSENSGTRRMAGRMLHLVQNMLDVHKFESTEVQLQKQSVSLDDLIYEAIEQVRSLLSEKNIQISKSLDDKITVSTDRDYLIRVFINFFTNAIKYSPNNSTIEVKGKVHGDRVDLSILDHGSGIAKEDQKGIFDAFKQIDARHSGQAASTGLGLAFCQLVLRAHGSEIEVDSEVGAWTEFQFSLPLSDAKAETSTFNRDNDSLTLSAEERQKILAAIPKLKSYGLHQAGEIELALKEFKTSSDHSTSRWVDEVLKAAYSNNQEYFDELIEKVES